MSNMLLRVSAMNRPATWEYGHQLEIDIPESLHTRSFIHARSLKRKLVSFCPGNQGSVLTLDSSWSTSMSGTPSRHIAAHSGRFQLVQGHDWRSQVPLLHPHEQSYQEETSSSAPKHKKEGRQDSRYRCWAAHFWISRATDDAEAGVGLRMQMCTLLLIRGGI